MINLLLIDLYQSSERQDATHSGNKHRKRMVLDVLTEPAQKQDSDAQKGIETIINVISYTCVSLL